jgi:PAS domain-containing protein
MSRSTEPPAQPDYRALFHATPAPHRVLSPELCIAAVNDAYVQATATTREELIGQYVFDAFPQNPEDHE